MICVPDFLFLGAEWSVKNGKKKKMRLSVSVEKTFKEGFQEFILDCKSRNLHQGTIIHYEVAIKQIYTHILADTPISELLNKTMPEI